MSWLFSQALVAAFSEANSSDGAPSAPSSSTPTPRAYLSPDRTTDFSRLSRFGMTFAPLTDDLGAELLTWFRAGFPVRTSVQQDAVPESTASDPASGWKWRESSVKYDPDMRLWRTRQFSLLEDSEWFSETWPRWGSMRDGECWELPMSERPIKESASGLWPTPNVPNGGRSCAHVTDWRGRTAYHNGKKVQVGLEHAAKHWTTSCADDTGHRQKRYAQGGTALSMQAGGQLNPTWVEWLMGWPLGWTDLKPSETDRCLSAPPKHGEG